MSMHSDPAAPPLVVATGIIKSFGQRAVLDGANLSLSASEIVEIRGANGAGKSTLLHCLLGVVRPDGGQIKWQVPFRSVGVALQGRAYVYDDLSCEQNLELCSELQGASAPNRDIMQLFGLEPKAKAGHLSPGMLQRLSLARAFQHQSKCVVLDEPLTGLDADGRAALLRALQAHVDQRGAALIVSHGDRETFREVARDRIRTLNVQNGRLEMSA